MPCRWRWNPEPRWLGIWGRFVREVRKAGEAAREASMNCRLSFGGHRHPHWHRKLKADFRNLPMMAWQNCWRSGPRRCPSAVPRAPMPSCTAGCENRLTHLKSILCRKPNEPYHGRPPVNGLLLIRSSKWFIHCDGVPSYDQLMSGLPGSPILVPF